MLKFALSVTLFAVSAASLAAQSALYFDQNGPLSGFGISNGSSYIWNTVEAETPENVWNTAAGGAGTFSAWNNANNDTALFRSGLASGSEVTINLAQAIGVGSLQMETNSTNFTLQATAATALHLNGTSSQGTRIHVIGNLWDGITVGTNVNLVGDIELTGSGGAMRITGGGSAYEGRITLNHSGANRGGFQFLAGSRVNENTKFTLNSGNLVMTAAATIGELRGTGGIIRASGGGPLTIQQTTNTEWGGQSGADSGGGQVSITKKGSGRLSWTNENVTHWASVASYEVEEGAFYVAGRIDRATNPNFSINVAAEATFGGTVDTNKRVVLAGAASQLDPGMFGQAGEMTLGFGLTGGNGGTFNFNLGGEDSAEQLLNSRIVITGGTVTLGGTKTVNLYHLGLQPLQAHLAYTLFDASAVGLTLTSGWDQNWTLGPDDIGNQTGLGISFFGFNENHQLQVIFIPEPSSLMGISAGALVLLAVRRRKLA